MKVTHRRLTSIFLVLLMTLSLMPTFAATAFADADSCTVTFVYDENDRDMDVAIAVDLGGKAEQPAEPERAGYQFLGWYDLADNAFDFANTVINEDVTLIAYWANGTEDDPFQIGDMDSLRWMRAAIAGSDGAIYRTKYYALTADIVYDGDGFSQIPSPAFSGTLDGQGHTITGLEISGAGLFATVSGTIKNLGLVNININNVNAYAGAFAAQTSGGFTLENCYATGKVTSGGNNVGGLVGYSYASGGKISNCYFSGSVEAANAPAGGLVGYAYGTDIENCYSAGNVTSAGSASSVGGILGDARAGATVQKCYSTSAVKGWSFVGGIVGVLNGGSAADCVALNSLVWSAQTNSGGYVGRVNGYGSAPGCYGWEDMLVIGTSAASGFQGTPISIAEINTTAGWPAIFWSGAWSYTAGQLPTLSGLGGQEATMPGWLQPLAAGMDWKVTFFYEDGVTPTLVKEAADQGLVQPPGDPLRDTYKFMGWYERGASEAFDFANPITTTVYLFASWAAPGTAVNPYQIANMDDLRWMSEMVNGTTESYRRMYYELTADIVYDGKGFNAMRPLTGSGGVVLINYNNAFQGQLDGAGHTITGLEINGQGLFGFISSGAVKNLGLIDVTVNANEYHPYVGAIVGSLDYGSAYGVSTGVIENCYVINGDVSGVSHAGGLAGFANAQMCVIKNSYFRGNVSGTNYTGGIAGGNYGAIENCYSAGSVSGGVASGGIAGNISNNATILNCYSTSAVNGLANAGGIAGSAGGNASLATCLALNPYVEATTAATGQAGRIVGFLNGNGAAVDSYAWEGITVNAAVTDVGENGFGLSTDYIMDGSGIPEVFTATPWAYTVGQLPVLAGLGAQQAGFGTCAVTFVYDENDRDLDVTVEVGVGGKVGKPTTPERAGYQFLGWYDQADNAFDFTKTVISEDLTLIAYWASGSADDPYQIGDMDGLRWMRAVIAGSDGTTYRTKNYVLTADIVYDNAGFNPIPAFSGTLDGQGHTVTGLVIDGGGLFTSVSGTVSNLGLVDITVNNANAYVGAITGQTSGGFKIENCYATGSVTGGSNYVGGLVGYGYGSGGKISNCYFNGGVTAGNAPAGGIAGYAYGIDIENCYSAGNVTCASTGSGVGGILGDSRQNATVQKCYSTSAVKGNSYVGGIVGIVNYGSVADCVALNSIVWATQANSVGNVGRVTGYGAATASYGWEDMPLIGNQATSAFQGIPLSTAEINTAAGWPAIFWSGAWSYTVGQLPILDGLSGQDGTMPGWLQPLAAGMDWKVTFFCEDGVTTALVKEVADLGLVQPPGDPVRGAYKFMGWYEQGSTEAFDFTSPINANVMLFANWAAPGTAVNPYLIANMDDLRWMSDMINANVEMYGRMYYELTADIVYDGNGFNAIRPLTGTGGVVQINNNFAFQGQLDGAGHTVTGLQIDGQGLFGFISSGTVKNLGLIDVTVNGKENHPFVGAIVGYLGSGSLYGVSTGLIENCYVINGSVCGVNPISDVGGLAGSINDPSGMIKNSYFRGSVLGVDYVGGIVGNSNGAIENAYSTGSVSGGSATGGIAGNISNTATILNSYSTSAVSGVANAGGLVGISRNNASLATCLALNPYVQATTAATGQAGRIVGYLNGNGTAVDCYAWEGTIVNAAVTDAGENGFGLSTDYIQDGSGIPEVFTTTPWAYTVGQLPILVGLGAQPTGFDTCTVTFVYDVNDPAQNVTVEALVGARTARPADPVKNGYEFAGWFLGEAEFDFDAAVTSGVTLVAKWEQGSAQFTPGDVNGDGVIDFDDVLDALNHYLGTTLLEGDAFLAADVNKDGVLDFDDVLDVLNHYLGTNLLDA